MNQRQRKRYIMARMVYITRQAKLFLNIQRLFNPTPEEETASKAALRAHWESLLSELMPEPEQPQVEKIWKVARVKDNVVVLEAKSLGEANEAIVKAARQKKAKLYLLDDEPYVFEQYDAKNFVHMV